MQRFLLALSTLFLVATGALAQVAVNPITNRIYVANEATDTVSVIDGATSATIATVPVGDRPVFIAVNPFNNRIYVNNTDAASLSVIDGATNTVETYPIGSTGPIAINPVTGKVFIVRFSSAAADEATIFDEVALSWYSVSLEGFAPNALAVDTVANQLIVSANASGEIRRIDASSSSDHPPTTPIGVWSKPVAVAVNPLDNRIYSLQDDARGPIAVITPDNEAAFLTPEGHGVGPKAVAVNPVTNKIYAAFAGEVIVIDGATLGQTFIPSGTGSEGPVGLGINMLTNKVYVPNADGTLTVIDGVTNATSMISIPVGATGIAVNPITNRYYVSGPSGVTVIGGYSGDTRQANPIVTTITPLPSDTGGTTGSITLDASSSFSPNAPQILGVYYQLDGEQGPWLKASGTGPYTATYSGLSPGTHTIRAYAVDSGVTSNMNTQQQNTPLVGTIAAYTFTADNIPPPPNVADDFDGNGTGDLAFEHSDGSTALWLMDGTTVESGAGVMGPATGWHVARIADFNGDGRSDLLWQHTDGRAAIYLMNGTSPSSTRQLLNAGDGWTVAGTPDLDGDGKADILFQHTDGRIAAWTMDGTTVASGATLLGAGSGWTVAATGDLDGDGKADIVWKQADGRHAVSLMSGTTIVSTTQILNAGAWTATHVADLDGDGKADIVWGNGDGSVAVWRMDGATMAEGAQLLGAGTGWSVALTGDFNGDGKADLLFEHTDGRAAIYLMNGVAPLSTAQVLNAGGGWSAASIVDLNGDGRGDIVWKNVDGSIAAWLMNGTAMSQGATLLGAGSGWSVIPGR